MAIFTDAMSEYRHREIMLFIGKPKGRSRMISNATNPLKESRKESLLRCAVSPDISMPDIAAPNAS